MPRIAVDAMGSDRAPGVELDACRDLLASRPEVRLVLVGDRELLAPLLAAQGLADHPRLTVRHATQVVTMDDAPAAAVRSKRDSSMRVAFELVKTGEADAVVSAGNSGAMLACGLLVLGRVKGIERPGIATSVPTVTGSRCVLCDTGANVEPEPEVLAQFALLGAIYAQVRGVARPRVGLLANGEEASKGTELTRAAHLLIERLAKTPGVGLDYVGYVEGRDVFSGEVDVVATDGFTGNVLLKGAEGAGLAILTLLKRAFRSSLRAKVGALLARPALLALKHALDYEETGGAPLLGVRGPVVLGHGGSSPRALTNAIALADDLAREGSVAAVNDAIARHSGLWSAGLAAEDQPAAGLASSEPR